MINSLGMDMGAMVENLAIEQGQKLLDAGNTPDDLSVEDEIYSITEEEFVDAVGEDMPAGSSAKEDWVFNVNLPSSQPQVPIAPQRNNTLGIAQNPGLYIGFGILLLSLILLLVLKRT